MDSASPSAVPSYITSIIRNVLAVVSGYIIGKGWLTGEQATAFGGAVLAALPLIWSLIQKKQANTALKAAIQAPSGDPGR